MPARCTVGAAINDELREAARVEYCSPEYGDMLCTPLCAQADEAMVIAQRAKQNRVTISVIFRVSIRCQYASFQKSGDSRHAEKDSCDLRHYSLRNSGLQAGYCDLPHI